MSYLHNSDVVRAVDLGVLGELLTQGGNGSLQVLALAAVLLLNVCVHAGRLRLQGRTIVRKTYTIKEVFIK